MPQFDEDMKIFEKIIEQKIFGKQKKLETDNDSKKNKSYNKINKIGTEKKKEFSNFIQNIFNETEIDLSEKTNPKKNRGVKSLLFGVLPAIFCRGDNKWVVVCRFLEFIS